MTNSDCKEVERSREAVLVLGMHRSGTSALSRVLSFLGCDLPATLLGETASNPNGHWESIAVMDLNDAILKSAGSAWNDWQPVSPQLYNSPVFAGYKSQAVKILHDEYGESPLFILKDPRNCRLLPFWLDVLDSENVTPLIVLSVRNPLEVGESLERRDLFHPELGQLLWLRHILDAEHASRGRSRFVSTYTELLDNWPGVADRMQRTFGVVWPRDAALAKVDIGKFLDPVNRHHVRSTEAVLSNPALSEWVRRAYAIMIEWAVKGENPDDYSVLDEIRESFNNAGPAFAKLIQAGVDDKEAVRNLQHSLESKQKDVAGLWDELGALRSVHEEAIERNVIHAQRLEVNVRQLEQETQEGEQRRLVLEVELEKATQVAEDLRHQVATAESALRQRQEELKQLWAELASERAMGTERQNELTALSEKTSLLSEKLAVADTWVFKLAGERRESEQREKSAIEKLGVAERHLAAARLAADSARGDAAAARDQVVVARREAEAAFNESLSAQEAIAAEKNHLIAARNESHAAFQQRDMARKDVLSARHEVSVAQSQLEAANEKIRLLLQADEVARSEAENKVAEIEAENALIKESIQERFEELAMVARLLREREKDADVAGGKSEWLRRVSAVLMGRPQWWAFVPFKWQRRWTNGRLLRKGLFDSDAYLTHNPDVVHSGIDPLQHYILHGISEGRRVN